jgi:hypothetical protein
MGEGPATVRVRHKKTRYYAAIGAATVLAAGVAVGTTVAGANAAPNAAGAVAVPKTSPASSWTITPPTATPIKHVVVIFGRQEVASTRVDVPLVRREPGQGHIGLFGGAADRCSRAPLGRG